VAGVVVEQAQRDLVERGLGRADLRKDGDEFFARPRS
jgi:hypothetical protein